MRRPPTGMAHVALRCAVAGCVVLLASCAALPQKPLPPRVEFIGVRVGRLQLTDMRLRVMLDVHNPNPYALRVESIDAVVAVGGVRLADASLASSVTLPSVATTRVELDLRTGLDKLLGAINSLPGSGPVPYEITGVAVVQDGVRLPFARRGELPVAQWVSGVRR